MKKTNKRADGTEEVLEGDPEELRKYEDLQKPQEQAPITETPNKRDILHGAPEVDGIPLTENEKEWVRTLRTLKLPDPVKTSPVLPDLLRPYPQPIWITYCSTCGKTGCQGGCWQLQPWPWYTITCTSDKVEQASLLIKDDGKHEMSHSLTDFLMGRAVLEVKTNGN